MGRMNECLEPQCPHLQNEGNNLHTKPYKVGVMTTPILQGGKLRIREFEELAQGHTARKAQDWKSLWLLILPPAHYPSRVMQMNQCTLEQ